MAGFTAAEPATPMAELARLLPLLPVIDAVGRTGHVTAAAEELGQPQSTVSRALARAGDVVGVALVVREGRGVRLTEAARTLLPAVRGALTTLDDGVERVRDEAGLAAGQVRIAFLNTFGEVTLPVLIEAFQQRHRGVRFQLVQGARDLCLDTLEEGRVDMALVAPMPARSARLRGQVLYREPLRLVVPSGHRLADREGVRLEEVRDEEFVVMGHGFGLRSLLDGLCTAAGFRPRIRFEGQDAHTLRGLVSAGLGVSVLPPSGPDHLQPAGGGLGWRELVIQQPESYREIGLIWRAESALATAADRFRQMIIAEGHELVAGLYPRR